MDGRDRERARPIAASTASSSRSTPSATARPINFGVALPAQLEPPRGADGRRRHERHRARTDRRRRPGSPSLLARGIVTYGSDSGHQAGFGLPRCGAAARVGQAAPGRPGGGAPQRPAECRPREDRSRGSRRAAPAVRRADGVRVAAAGRPPPMTGHSTTRRWPTSGYMQMKKTHDAAMVHRRAAVRCPPALQLLHRVVAGRPRGADRRAALSGRLRRHRRERADRRLLHADARARTDSHSGEAARQLGHAGQGQRHSRRVHAPVRHARRSRRRHHQQLHGVPRDLRRHAGEDGTTSVGGQAVPRQRRSESGGHHAPARV